MGFDPVEGTASFSSLSVRTARIVGCIGFDPVEGTARIAMEQRAHIIILVALGATRVRTLQLGHRRGTKSNGSGVLSSTRLRVVQDAAIAVATSTTSKLQ